MVGRIVLTNWVVWVVFFRPNDFKEAPGILGLGLILANEVVVYFLHGFQYKATFHSANSPKPLSRAGQIIVV